MKKISLGIIGLSLIFGVMGCESDDNSRNTAPNQENQNNENQNNEGQNNEIQNNENQNNENQNNEGQNNENQNNENQNNEGQNNENQNNEGQNTEQTKSIVVYFSRAQENYNVGYIEIGNTAKVAAELAKQTNSDIFEITPVEPFPSDYMEMVNLANEQKAANARPLIATTLENFDQYDTVYLGYPIWCADLPMILYTFLENYSFEGKTIIPFNTHEGSGSAGTWDKIRAAAPGSIVMDGLVIQGTTAQNNPSEVTNKVSEFIANLSQD